MREELLLATNALEVAQIPYAVIGGNAVAAWIVTVHASAVRNTPNVNIPLRRLEFDRASGAIQAAGIEAHHLNDPNAIGRDLTRICFAGEKVREEYEETAPDVSESIVLDRFRVLTLEPLLRMKLTSFRRIDAVHVHDLIEVGLVDQSWVTRLPPELGTRLQQLLDTPEG